LVTVTKFTPAPLYFPYRLCLADNDATRKISEAEGIATSVQGTSLA
jgi:hypothetical protein